MLTCGKFRLWFSGAYRACLFSDFFQHLIIVPKTIFYAKRQNIYIFCIYMYFSTCPCIFITSSFGIHNNLIYQIYRLGSSWPFISTAMFTPDYLFVKNRCSVFSEDYSMVNSSIFFISWPITIQQFCSYYSFDSLVLKNLETASRLDYIWNKNKEYCNMSGWWRYCRTFLGHSIKLQPTVMKLWKSLTTVSLKWQLY